VKLRRRTSKTILLLSDCPHTNFFYNSVHKLMQSMFSPEYEGRTAHAWIIEVAVLATWSTVLLFSLTLIGLTYN